MGALHRDLDRPGRQLQCAPKGLGPANFGVRMAIDRGRGPASRVGELLAGATERSMAVTGTSVPGRGRAWELAPPAGERATITPPATSAAIPTTTRVAGRRRVLCEAASDVEDWLPHVAGRPGSAQMASSR